jgi:hypothetical protein
MIALLASVDMRASGYWLLAIGSLNFGNFGNFGNFRGVRFLPSPS